MRKTDSKITVDYCHKGDGVCHISRFDADVHVSPTGAKVVKIARKWYAISKASSNNWGYVFNLNKPYMLPTNIPSGRVRLTREEKRNLATQSAKKKAWDVLKQNLSEEELRLAFPDGNRFM